MSFLCVIVVFLNSANISLKMNSYEIVSYFSEYRAISAAGIEPESIKKYVIPALRNTESPAFADIKKREKRRDNREMPLLFHRNIELKKYWDKRHLLFSKYDQGILLDEESWYSVTPEQIAAYTAKRCQCDTIIDGFCGAGGNAIQFAFTCKRVIAVDIDPEKIKLAKNNAKIYGVLDKIKFICGDFFQLARNGELVANVVFFSPPWGGPSYRRTKEYDPETMLQPLPFSELLKTTKKISLKIAAFLPKNSSPLSLINGTEPGGKVQIESIYIDDKAIGVMVYYDDLAKEEGRMVHVL